MVDEPARQPATAIRGRRTGGSYARPVPGRSRPKHRAKRQARGWAAGAGAGLLVASAVALAWAADDGPGVADAAPSTSPATSPTTTSVPPTTTSAPPPPEPITIAFAGDVIFEGSNAARLERDPVSVFGDAVALLAGADLAVVNMETAIGTTGAPAPKEFTFQAPPSALAAFRAAGIDVVSAANNHGLDYGLPSLEEGLAAETAAGLPVIGIGRDEAEAYAPFVAEVRGQRIAVVAATQVLDDDLIEAWTAGPARPGLASAKRVDRLVETVTSARAGADTVVVFLHWGIERHTCPSASQQDLARTLVDAGADVVVGGHAHRLQGGGRLGDAVVHYGLGNFAFPSPSADGARTGVFTVTVTGRHVNAYQWHPGRITDGQPNLLAGAEADDALAYWNGLRDCTNLSP